jgi:hypothetical protein
VKLSRFAFVVLLFAGIGAHAQQGRTPTPPTTSTPEDRSAAANSQLTKAIADVLLRVATVKPGMTRGELLKIFTEEGGMYTRWQHTYVYRGCPYIKVDVQFAPAPGTESDQMELNEDTIVKISRPYLYWSIAD